MNSHVMFFYVLSIIHALYICFLIINIMLNASNSVTNINSTLDMQF